jgi:hypothetical protein
MHTYNLVWTPERKILLGRPRHRCEDNIKMDLKEIGCEDVHWIHLDQNRALMTGSCDHGNKLSGFIKGGEFLDYESHN